MNRSRFFVFLLAVTTPFAARGSADTIHVDSVHIKLLKQVEVPAREAGVLQEVPVKEGDLVEQGAMLAQIEDDEAQVAVQRAEVELSISKLQTNNIFDLQSSTKALEVAAKNLERAHLSVQRFENSISKADLDDFQLKSDQLQIEVERARFALELAKLNVRLLESELAAASKKLENRTITAPLSGYVVEIMRQPGEWVQPGETVLRMIRVDRLRAEGFVNAADVQGDLRGVPVTLWVDMLDKTKARFSGQIQFVDAEIDPLNGQIRVWAEVENKTLTLKPGLRAEMTIQSR